MIEWGVPLPAPAKLNLFLHVVGRRDDGYHLLQSAFRMVDRCDWIRLDPRADGQVRQAVGLAGVPEDVDLTVRAARLLRRAAGVKEGVSIGLDKRLPTGGGLGGGSSDAATVLLALNRLWGLGWPAERLQALGLELGADVPFFVFGRSAFVEGVGERLQPVVLAPAWYLVIEPGVTVPTREIFARPELTRNTKAIKIIDFSEGRGRNDLQPVACGLYPAIAEAIAWLSQYGDARMTGSGACVFATFADEYEAASVLARMPRKWRGWVARGLDAHPMHAG